MINYNKRKIRLMQISHDLAIGGLQQVVVNICKNINRQLFDISVLCLRDRGIFSSEIEKLGIEVFCLPQKEHKTDYFSFFKVADILKRQQIDIIHTHNTQPFIDGTIGALLAGIKTIIHTDHARSFPDKKRYMFAEWLMSKFAYKVVGVSEHTSQNLIKFEKISPKKVITILNGIDRLKFNIELDKNKKKKELGIEGKNPIIGLGVRLIEQKGISYLLEAMKEIIKSFPDIILIIAGDGPHENVLKNLVNILKIDKNILFIGPRTDIPELLKIFDIYVLPSLSEGLPMVLLEAMAAGCPIVASDVGGIPIAISHGDNGSLVQPKSTQALSFEIIKLLKNKNIRLQYINNSYKIINKKFNAKIMTEKYENLYLEKNKISSFFLNC